MKHINDTAHIGGRCSREGLCNSTVSARLSVCLSQLQHCSSMPAPSSNGAAAVSSKGEQVLCLQPLQKTEHKLLRDERVPYGWIVFLKYSVGFSISAVLVLWPGYTTTGITSYEPGPILRNFSGCTISKVHV